MNKLLTIISKLPFFLFYVFFIPTAYAITIPSPIDIPFHELISKIATLIKPVVILVFLGVFFWGGFTIQTSGPNTDKLQKGWKIILGAVIGLIVIAVGPSVVDLVGDLLGIQNVIEF